jgi:iron complex outermembrane recepter protein
LLKHASPITLLISVLIVSTPLCCPSSWADDAPTSYNILSQDLGSALREFAHQSRLQILFSTEVVASKTSQSVSGVLSADAALTQILFGTGLGYTKSADGTILISPVSATGIATPQRSPGTAATEGDTGTPNATQAAGGLEEIIVTAQKRPERLHDVPISIVALTEDALETAGVTNTLSLTNIVPGLKFDRIGAYTEISIRGISNQITAPGVDPAVATYVDGIYQPSTLATTFDLPDVNRIDVTKGPQGTLFGRNATGGAIQVFTLDPGFSTEGRLFVSYGSFNDQIVKGYVSGPLIDQTLAASFSGYEETSEPYIHTLQGIALDGARNYLGRVKLLYTPDENAKLVVIGYYGRHNDPQSNSGPAFDGVSIAQTVPGSVIPTRPWTYADNLPQKDDVLTYGASGHGTLTTGIGVWNLVAGYSYSNPRVGLEYSAAYIPGGNSDAAYENPDKSEQVDLNLASKAYGSFSYVAGVFFFHDRAQSSPVLLTDTIPGSSDFVANIYGRQDTDAYAAYSEITEALTDDWSVILGVRYNDERRSAYGGSFGALHSFSEDYPTGSWPLVAQKTFVGWTPRATVRYHLSDATNIYATYNEGFKSGAFDVYTLPAPGQPATYLKPEKIRAYEVGMKSTPSSRYEINTAAFLYRYTDQQVTAYVNQGGLPLPEDLNAASSTIYGVDIDAKARPVDALVISGGVEWLRAHYDQFPNAILDIPAPGNAGNVSTPGNASGTPLPLAPKWTANFSATYTWDVGTGHLDLTGNAYHSDTVYYDTNLFYRQRPYTVLGAEAAYHFEHHWTVALWGKNLTDAAYLNGELITAYGTTAGYAPPRTGGISVSFDF